MGDTLHTNLESWGTHYTLTWSHGEHAARWSDARTRLCRSASLGPQPGHAAGGRGVSHRSLHGFHLTERLGRSYGVTPSVWKHVNSKFGFSLRLYMIQHRNTFLKEYRSSFKYVSPYDFKFYIYIG